MIPEAKYAKYIIPSESNRVLIALSLVPSPSYAKREKGSGQKGRTSASGWNAIIGNSGVRKIETNRHFRTVCIDRAHARTYGPRIITLH